MTTDRQTPSTSASDQAFDARLQQLHAQAIAQLPGRTLLQLQLRPRRTPATAARPRLHAWPLAATCALCLVVGGLVLRQPLNPPGTPPVPASPVVAIPTPATTESEPASAYAALDESPELYLWLASEDNEPLALE